MRKCAFKWHNSILMTLKCIILASEHINTFRGRSFFKDNYILCAICSRVISLAIILNKCNIICIL